MEEQIKFIRIFSEIDSLNERLSVLGREAKPVLGQMLNSGVKMDVVAPLLVKARKAERANMTEEFKGNDVKEPRRCKWWNRGYCREQGGCSFSHPREDCQDHLQGGCNTKGCRNLRHRKKCKYFETSQGCYRGENCEYLHVKIGLEKENNVDVMTEKQVQTESEKVVEDKETQTRKEKECVCKEHCESSRVHYDKDRVICIMKRAHCSEEEWEEYEEKVES